MNGYRTELRIFGLLIVALVSTMILYFGISAADVEGTVLGVNIKLAGPAAFFVALLLVFRFTGLFTLELLEERLSNRSVETLTKEEINNQLDKILIESRRLERRRQELENAKTALENHADPDAVDLAGGIRAVRRPIGPSTP